MDQESGSPSSEESCRHQGKNRDSSLRSAVTLLAKKIATPLSTGGWVVTGRNGIMLNELPSFSRSNHVHHLDRITFDSQIMGGRACIRGMRIPVSVVVSQVAHGASNQEILNDYPELKLEDIQQALCYAAWLTQDQIVAV